MVDQAKIIVKPDISRVVVLSRKCNGDRRARFTTEIVEFENSRMVKE